MKLLVLLFLFTSCGRNEGLKLFARDLIGANYDQETKHGKQKDKEQDTQIENLKERIEALEENIDVTVGLINQLQDHITELQDTGEESEENINTFQEILENLQDEVNDNLVELTLLIETETANSIQELVDPCGDGSGYDEILIRTKSNELIAYFEVGAKRFLSKLTPGNYSTTDNTGCSFSVDSNMNVSW